MKVLIMFGLPMDGAGIRRALQNYSRSVICMDQEFTPEGGVRKIILNRPDLMFIHLDGMEETAFSFIRQIREKDNRIRMIAVGSRQEYGLLQKVIRLGCDDYLLKPFGSKEMNDILNRLFGKGGAADAESRNCVQEQQEFLRRKSDLVNEIFYSRENVKPYTVDAWLDAVYTVNRDHAVLELIDFSFTIKKLLIRLGGSSEARDNEQKRLVKNLSEKLFSGLYASETEEDVRSAFHYYVDCLAKICRTEFISNNNNLVELAKKIINERIDQKVTLEMVASEIYISPFYLSRIFKKNTGENFAEYIMNAKISEAKKLLLSGGKTIDEIALQVGYDEPNSFRRMFKKKVGVCPGDYRKSMGGISRTVQNRLA